MSKDGRYLGVDPGIKNFGYGIVEVRNEEIHFISCGKIPNLAKNYAEMLCDIRKGMGLTITINNIVHAGFEEVFFARNRSAAMSTAKAIGALEMACSEFEVPCDGITPASLKKITTGNGRASKEDMRSHVINAFSEKLDLEISQWEKSVPENDSGHPYWKKSQLEGADEHSIDAIAVALWLISKDT